MTIKFYAHSRSKRAVDIALVDSGATENFMNLKYAQYLGLPIQEMKVILGITYSGDEGAPNGLQCRWNTEQIRRDQVLH